MSSTKFQNPSGPVQRSQTVKPSPPQTAHCGCLGSVHLPTSLLQRLQSSCLSFLPLISLVVPYLSASRVSAPGYDWYSQVLR